MRIVGDFHIHSKYARAVSPDMDLERLDLWAHKKGITVLGTGDFTHPAWFRELCNKLEPAEPGLYMLRREHRVHNGEPTRFLCSVEISNIYSKGGRVRKVHNVIFAPSLEDAEKINAALSIRGNLESDGRPILGLDSKELLKIVLQINPACLFAPAHAWTPWFSVFGSKSGFDSLEECFEDLTDEIHVIETGLSSDPAMNWRLAALDSVGFISNSDAHSPRRIGREANVVKSELSYAGIVGALISHDPERFLFTVEFFPEEGKYHYDGHRACGISCTPEETAAYAGRCPVCERTLTIGVLHRVNKLADRPEEFKRPGAIPFKSLIPLEEIIADAFGVGVETKKVQGMYEMLVETLASELVVLTECSIEEIREIAGPAISEGIRRMRSGELSIIPGSDGEYGKISIFVSDSDRALYAKDTRLL